VLHGLFKQGDQVKHNGEFWKFGAVLYLLKLPRSTTQSCNTLPSSLSGLLIVKIIGRFISCGRG